MEESKSISMAPGYWELVTFIINIIIIIAIIIIITIIIIILFIYPFLLLMNSF